VKLPGFSTRKFPLWLQAFNLLCAFTALVILGFGVWHLLGREGAAGLEGVLAGRGEAAIVDTAVLARRLATSEGGSALDRKSVV
jgi:hypothetical protein